MPENYVLKVKIDDTDLRKLEKRLAGIMTGKSVSSGSSSSTQNNSMTKNLAKLGVIATAVTGLLAVTKKLTSVLVDSSPMLQQMLKLLNFSIMLIFRPIGDFIGFLLRPIMIFFLRRFIIPWYKDVYPVMKTLGIKVGNAIKEVGKILFPANEDAAITAGKLVAILAGGVTISTIAAKKAGTLIGNKLLRFAPQTGGDMGIKFNKKVQSGAVKNLKEIKPKGINTAANKLLTAFRKLNSLKFPSIPKPTWLGGFNTTVDKLVNILTGNTKQTSTKTPMKSPTKTGTGLKGHGGNWALKDFMKGRKSSVIPKVKGGSTKVGKGLNALMLWDLLVSPGDLGGWLPQTGQEGDAGYVDLNAGNPLDALPTTHEIADAVINGITGLFQQQQKPNITVYQTVTDKSTADYMSTSLQSGWNK